MEISLPSELNLIDTARLLHSSGFNTSYRGVLAARYDEQGVICITAAEKDFKSIEREDFCLVNLAGEAVNGASPPELPAHLKFYLKVFQDRADAIVLAHVYPPYASAFAEKAELFELSKDPAQSPVREFIRVECLECPSRFTGLCSCRTDIRKSYAGADALMIKEDGIIVMAADLDSLFLKVESIENSAQKASRPTL